MTSATPTLPPFSASKYIKEIGRGVNGARALPREDAQMLFDAMLAGRVSDIELGAVLMAYRIKGEAPHELAGMLEAAHGHCAPLAPPPDKPVVVIPSYNGARTQPNLVPLLALLLARGTEGEVVADARRSSRIDWLHDGHQRTMVDPASGSIGEVPELPPGTDVGLTAAWIRKVLDGDVPVPVPAPIATQVATIQDCLKQATRVAWASPV